MALGLCDVKDCESKTYLGWRPNSVPQSEGKQICQDHWERHKSPGSFSLFKAFGVPEPVLVIKARPKPIKHTESPKPARLCVCGIELLPRKQYCSKCADERERERKRRRRWLKKQQERPEIETEQPMSRYICKLCGSQREKGHTYCSKCSLLAKRKKDRARQLKLRKNVT